MSGRHLTRTLLELVSTVFQAEYCQYCGIEVSQNQALCHHCDQQLPRIVNPCQICAMPNPGSGEICANCLLNPPRWQSLFAAFQYRDQIRQFIMRLKYAEATWVARLLCNSAASPVDYESLKPEVLLPVPLHPDRLHERGYNQAAEIASQWSARFDLPVDYAALKRVKPTESQSGLDARQRRKNLRQAFCYKPATLYRHVTIVDDVVTTGATIDEITKLLHQSGVEYVEVWALARTIRRKGG